MDSHIVQVVRSKATHLFGVKGMHSLVQHNNELDTMGNFLSKSGPVHLSCNDIYLANNGAMFHAVDDFF